MPCGAAQSTINVNGQRPSNNNYQLGGINANDINLPALDNVPLPDPQTVREFKTQTSLYDASQGRSRRHLLHDDAARVAE
jgi:hypothetical protein